MLADSKGSVVVSNLGWVDHGNLWVLETGREQANTVTLSDAKYVSLHPGNNDYFSVNHRFDGPRAKITVHHFSKPGEVVARAILTSDSTEVVGDLSVWSNVQKNYVVYYTGPFWSESCLLQVTPQAGRIELKQFGWYDSDYDKGYQGVIGVVENPDDGLLIVSVQRDSHPSFMIRIPKGKSALSNCAIEGETRRYSSGDKLMNYGPMTTTRSSSSSPEPGVSSTPGDFNPMQLVRDNSSEAFRLMRTRSCA